MDKLAMIGLEAAELPWLRRLVALLRHPDPVVGEVTREALRYLESIAERAGESKAAG